MLCDPESIIGYFDTDKLDKILYNLLSNAAKYTKEDGFIQVTLSYAENKDWVLLRVKDNGKGISKEKQNDTFAVVSTRVITGNLIPLVQESGFH